MSLTNPNSVVTEERLSEFYQGILPYLGGMPDILANKFDKANMFSTDEKIIGQWIDGKPLYQKVFVSSNAFAIGTSWINTGWDVSFANVLVNTQIIDSVGQVFCGVNAGFISGNLGLQAFNTISNAKICILQYTKTADSPVEIGIDTDYSTTEKIVGTWIDGRPIYQVTINGLKFPESITDGQTSTKTYTLSSFGITNLNFVVYKQSMSEMTWQAGDNSKTYIRRSWVTSTEIQISSNRTTDANTNFSPLTIQYVKTS